MMNAKGQYSTYLFHHSGTPVFLGACNIALEVCYLCHPSLLNCMVAYDFISNCSEW